VRRYLLDTPVLAAYLLGRSWAVSVVDPWVLANEAATSPLVYGEVIAYIEGMRNYRTLREQLRRQLIDVRLYTLTYPIMERYAAIRRFMRSQGGLIGDVDTLIAATAIERSLTVVNLDGHFLRVHSLAVQIIARP